MTQQDIKDIKLGALDVQHLMFRYWEVWPNSGTKHQKDWPYIVFTNFSETDEAIIYFDKGRNRNANYIEFSTDGINWYNIQNDETSFYRNGAYRVTIGGKNSRKSVYFRGSNYNDNKSFYGFHILVFAPEKFYNGNWGYTNPDVHCFGNIMSLLDYQTIPTEITTGMCFCSLFNSSDGYITDPDVIGRPNVLKSANILYADKLCKECYKSMFAGCTSLVKAPDLPAYALGEWCYSGMFTNCTSLIKAPDLPATELAEWCYSTMFANCTSLVKAPEIHATTLDLYCCSRMFIGCTSLTEGTTLYAKQTIQGCYESMFKGCTSLVKAPEIQAIQLWTRNPWADDGCCKEMFADCTSLVKAPDLPATKLGEKCYSGMFKNCTSLTEGPDLPSMSLAAHCYEYMFQGCTSLVKAPNMSFTTVSAIGDGTGYQVTNMCQYMFKNCKSLNYVKLLYIRSRYGSTYSNFLGWLEGVSETGTFVKNKDATWENSDIGIPEGWTVITE